MQLIKLGKPLVHDLRTCKIALQCLSHELIIAKLNAYGFTFPVFNFIHEYLSKRQQKTKINNSYSTWSEILFDSPRFHTRVYFI